MMYENCTPKAKYRLLFAFSNFNKILLYYPCCSVKAKPPPTLLPQLAMLEMLLPMALLIGFFEIKFDGYEHRKEQSKSFHL